MTNERPVTLLVLDGWGLAEPGPGNAISLAGIKHLPELSERGASVELEASGRAVGLPAGVMGNSEVGHLTIGAGRAIDQDLCRIAEACRTGRLKENPELRATFQAVSSSSGRLHHLGLCSDAGVHSDLAHLEALVAAAAEAGVERQFVHCFTDGRDTPPDSGRSHVERVERFLSDVPGASIATVGGRYHGMDRDSRWDRIERAYRTMVLGEGPSASTAVDAVLASYDAGVSDEFIEPVLIDPDGTLRDGDAAVFFNFRADRARQLTRALTEDGFSEFDLRRPELARYVTMTEYDADFDLPVLFPVEAPEHTLGEVFAEAGWPQLRLAETEKYAHVTYFLNGGREHVFDGEERTLVPSPRVATYDLEPAMSAVAVTDQAERWIRRGGGACSS